MNLSKAEILNYLKTDRAILIGCILLALIFWLSNKMSESFYTEIEVPIAFELPIGKALTSNPPKKLNVTYKGSGWELLGGEELEPILFKLPNNRNSVQYSRSQIVDQIKASNPGLKEIADIDITYFEATLEDQGQKRVPVVLNKDFKLIEQYLVKSIQISPDSVDISGPHTLIADIQQWETQLLTIDNLKNSTETKIELKKSNEVEGEELIFITPNEINVSLEVEQYTEKSMYLPITILNGPDSLKIFPDKIMVNCNVSLNEYDALSFRDFQAEVNFQGVSLGGENNTIPVQLKSQPPNVSNVGFSPKSVEFFFIEQLAVEMIEGSPIDN